MKVWLLVINGKPDSVHRAGSNTMSERLQELKKTKGDALTWHSQEFTVRGDE